MNKVNRGHRGGLNPNYMAPTVIGQSALGNNIAEGVQDTVQVLVLVNGTIKVIGITQITATNPVIVTAPNHGLSNGNTVIFYDVPGMFELNKNKYTVQGKTVNTFELYSGASPLNGTTFTPFPFYSADGNGVAYSSERYVPLVFDPISGTYCAPLSKVNQEERLQALEVSRVTYEDMSFLYRAGFVNGPNQPVNVI
jgi:hypothetical protein